MRLKLSKGHDFKLKNHPLKEIVVVSEKANQIILHPLDYITNKTIRISKNRTTFKTEGPSHCYH